MTRTKMMLYAVALAASTASGGARAENNPLAAHLRDIEARFPPIAFADPLAARIRDVDARFTSVASAVSEGYTPISCASGPDGGAMGVHYVNGALLKSGRIDIAHPQAIMYEPEPDGSLALVAVEYITLKGPASLDGHLFNFNAAPNRYGLGRYYDLHVWAWRANPRGTFAEMNPKVSCDAMPLD